MICDYSITFVACGTNFADICGTRSLAMQIMFVLGKFDKLISVKRDKIENFPFTSSYRLGG